MKGMMENFFNHMKIKLTNEDLTELDQWIIEEEKIDKGDDGMGFEREYFDDLNIKGCREANGGNDAILRFFFFLKIIIFIAMHWRVS